MTRKYYVNAVFKDEWIYLVTIRPRKSNSLISQGDMISLSSKLGLDVGEFDHAYSGAELAHASSNNDLYLSYFYVEESNTLYFSVIPIANQGHSKIAELISDLENLDEDNEYVKY